MQARFLANKASVNSVIIRSAPKMSLSKIAALLPKAVISKTGGLTASLPTQTFLGSTMNVRSIVTSTLVQAGDRQVGNVLIDIPILLAVYPSIRCRSAFLCCVLSVSMSQAIHISQAFTKFVPGCCIRKPPSKFPAFFFVFRPLSSCNLYQCNLYRYCASIVIHKDPKIFRYASFPDT